MNLSFDGANTKVYDDVITEEEFKNIFDFINGHPFTFRHPVGEWNKVWDCQKEEGNNFSGYWEKLQSIEEIALALSLLLIR